MSEKNVSWYRRLNGGLWQSEVEHGTLPERRDSFEDGTNFDTTFGYPTKRGGYTRLNAARPGGPCLKTNFSKKGRAHIQFGDHRLGATAVTPEFHMGVSVKIPDDFKLEANQCAPLLMRPATALVAGAVTYYYEFMLFLKNIGGAPNCCLYVVTRDPVAGTNELKIIELALGADEFTNGAWHRADFQYWVHGGAGHICLVWDASLVDQAQVDFSADHYWLNTAADAGAAGAKVQHAGQIYVGGLPGRDWDTYLSVEGLIYDLYLSEFRYDEEAYYTAGVSNLADHASSYTGDSWISDQTVDADVVTHMDEGGGVLLAGTGTEWELPGAMTNSRPAWSSGGGLTLLGGTWRENPGIVVLETGDGKTPLSSIFGPDASKLLTEWTMHFRLVQPPFLGQDGDTNLWSIIASQGFNLVGAGTDESPSGWVLYWGRGAGAANWSLNFQIKISSTTTTRTVNLNADSSVSSGDIWVTIRRDATNLSLDSTYGSASAAHGWGSRVTQLMGNEPLVIGAKFESFESYKYLRPTYSQAMFTIKEFRVLPYAVNDERVATTSWRSEYQDPHRDYIALFHFKEGQGTDLIDFSNSRLRGKIVDSGTNETYLVAAAVVGAPGTPALWGTRRYGDLMPMSWVREHPYPAINPIDAVTIYHHPQVGDSKVAIGDGHAWRIDDNDLIDIAAEYGSIEVPKPDTLDYAQFGGRVYVADGSNRPQVLEVGRFRPTGLLPAPYHAAPGVLPYPGADVTGYVTYLVCYENVEAGVISDGVVTDPVYLDASGAMIGWEAGAAGVQGVPVSEIAAAPGVISLTRAAAAVTTWIPDVTVGPFTWEGMIKFNYDHIAGVPIDIWDKASTGPVNQIVGMKKDLNGGVVKLFPYIRTGGAYTQLTDTNVGINVPSLGVWHHYAWTYTAGTHRFYVDGRLYLEQSVVGVTTTAALPQNNNPGATRIHYHVSVNDQFEIAEWRHWNRARTESEIANQYHVSMKVSADTLLIFNLSPKSTSIVLDEVNRSNAALGTDLALNTGVINWLDAPDYSNLKQSRTKYAPLPLCKELATHLRFYRSSPHALGATPTPAEVEEAKQSATAGPWRYVGRAAAGDTYWVDRTYMDTEGSQLKLGEVETPPLGAYYVERFGAMMAYARTDRYPERIWVSRLWAPEMIPAALGWVDIDDGTGEPITGMAALGDRLYVFKATSIWAVTGAESSILSLNLVSRGQGCISNRSAVQAMGRLWIWTSQGPGVLDGGNVVSLSMPITAELRKMYDADKVIGVSDPKRHRVGWLVQQDPDVATFGISYSNNENSAILWYDYVYQIWSKHTWAHKHITPPYADPLVIKVTGLDCMFNHDAVVRGHDAQEHEICIVDSKGFIYQYDPTTLVDGFLGKDLFGPYSMTRTTATDTIAGFNGLITDSLVGLPVMLIYTHLYVGAVHVPITGDDIMGFPVWCVVKSNTATTVTLDVPAIIAGKTTCYVGAIDFWLQHAWSDGGQPLKGKIFERFYWRPTTYDQTWFAFVYVQRSMANYSIDPGDNPVTAWAKIPGDGRFQMDLFEQGARLKWVLSSPIPGAAGLQEAGWQGRILPGDLIPHTPGTAISQVLGTVPIWPGDPAFWGGGALGAPGVTDEGAVPPAGEA